ncbi:hypothetical protein VYU27_008980, partial [Nannochloropsis oceanica]
MIWSVSPLVEYVEIQVAGNGQTSLSIGVISGKPRMVDTPYHQVMLLSDCHKSQSIRASVGPMTFAYTCSYSREDIGAFGPTAEQRRDQSQRDCLHGMKDSVDLDEKKAHGGAAALFSLATLSAAADPLPVSTPCYPSSWASSLVAANHVLELQKQAVDKSLQSFLTQYQQQSAIHQHAILDDKMTNVLSQATPSFLAQQHHQLQQYFNRSHLPLQLHYFLQCQMQPTKKQHMMASTKCFSMNDLPLTTEHVEAKIYPPIAPLSETPLLLQEIRAGVMGVSVGRLSGRYSKIMGKYLPSTEKQRRARKEDLSGLTAEEKVERRKVRARMYNRLSRYRCSRLHGDLHKDVSRMEMYKNIVEDAPDMICVISPDIQSQVLYINKT